MRNKRGGLTSPAFWLTFVFLLLVSGCGAAVEQPAVAPVVTEPANLTPATIVQETAVFVPATIIHEPADDVVITEEAPSSSNPSFFAASHVIVSGPVQQVKEVIKAVNPEFSPEETLNLWYLNDIPDDCLGLPTRSGDIGKDWVITLYRTMGADELQAPGVTPPQAVNEINTYAEKYGLPVYADAVYRVGDPPVPVTGDPWIGGGSPWIGGGSSPDDAVAAQGDFWTQWALGPFEEEGKVVGGIELMIDGDRSTELRGENIRVGVFDTSPLPDMGTHPITWITPTLQLDMQDVESGTNLEFPIWQPPPPIVDDHGLFVAGLIHAVAPDSEIHLYQVLNDSRQGDLFILNTAVHNFIEETIDADVSGAVINLSLGGYSVRDLLGRGLPAPTVNVDPEVMDAQFQQMPKDVYSLKTILSAADCLGFIVVAAAGNDAAGKFAEEIEALENHSSKESQIPASFPESISVGASNINGGHSCYSNSGLVYAPGGDGVGPIECEPFIRKCLDDCEKVNIDCLEECGQANEGCVDVCKQTYGICLDGCADFALTGLVVFDSDEFPAGYAYWAGTSFSTPLVSGLAALALQSQGPWPDVDCVKDRIIKAAAGNNGIINIPATMALLEGSPCSTTTP